MNGFNLNLISKYRAELMGGSTLLILICHAAGNDVLMPKWLMYVVAQAQLGVDIFLFLSGMGLYYSLSTNRGGVKSWYVRRYKRILIPYLAITVPLGIINVIVYHENVLRVLSGISTLQYWISHQAAWFIALLLPLYAVAPCLYRWLKRKGGIKCIAVFIVCYAIALWPTSVSATSFFGNVQFAIIRVPIFVLGMYLGPQILEGKRLGNKTILLSFVLAGVIMGITRKPCPSYFFLVLPILYILTSLLNTTYSINKCNKVLCFFGAISLESYMLNTCLPKYLHSIMDEFHISDYGNYLFYILVLVVGLALSVIVNKLIKWK